MNSFFIDEEDNGNYPDYSSNCIFEDQYQNIWIGTFGSGLFKYEKASQKFIAYPNTISSDDSFDGNIVHQIVAFSEDTVLLNTSNGIYKFNTSNNT